MAAAGSSASDQAKVGNLEPEALVDEQVLSAAGATLRLYDRASKDQYMVYGI